MNIIPDGVIRASDHVIIVNAGENLTENDSVYVDSADSLAYKCDADDLAKIGFIGFVVADATSGNPCYIKPDGHKGGFTGLTPGDIYYVSGTAGEITNTKPTNYKMVAKAVTATTVRIITEPTVRVRTYTADDTWVKPAGLLYAKIQVQSAGGGGRTSRNGPGGGAGAYTEKYVLPSELGSSETVTVGSGGPAGTAGELSSFTITNSTDLSCTPGAGATDDGTPGNGGIATGGDLNIDGGDGFHYATEGNDNNNDTGYGGNGGSSYFGGGGKGGYRFTSTTGNTGKAFGSGGGGGGNYDGNGNGGPGKQGVVIVTEFY